MLGSIIDSYMYTLMQFIISFVIVNTPLLVLYVVMQECIINPRCVCAERITVLVRSVCLLPQNLPLNCLAYTSKTRYHRVLHGVF